MNIEALVKITSRAWSVPILAALHDGTAGRQAALLAATGAGRGAFAHSLAHLIALGLIERNPGHGHPLRPEFRLTAAGQQAAALAHRVQSVTPPDAFTMVRRTWTLPVIGALGHPSAFSQIKGRLPQITDRALSQALRGLEAQNWVERQIATGRPPRPLYMAAGRGKALVSALELS